MDTVLCKEDQNKLKEGRIVMQAEEIWSRFQKYMGYTDEEMKIFRSDPKKVKMVTETPEFAKARVIAESGETAFGRPEILTIVVGSAREIDYWSGYASVGGNVRSGNSDQVDYTARLGTMRRSVRNRSAFDYIGTITRIDDEDTTNNHRVTVGWDHFLGKKWFVNVVGLEWYRDPFQNVADRWANNVGVTLDGARLEYVGRDNATSTESRKGGRHHRVRPVDPHVRQALARGHPVLRRRVVAVRPDAALAEAVSQRRSQQAQDAVAGRDVPVAACHNRSARRDV